jgi:rubrerythrin
MSQFHAVEVTEEPRPAVTNKVISIRDLRARNEIRCRRILGKSELLVVDDLDWDAVGAYELDAGVIDTLVYMRDVEGFTDTYVVGLAAHRTTLSDPLVRDFLQVWKAEEAAHSQAIARFLDAYALATGAVIAPPPPAPTPVVPRYERVLAHVGGPVGTVVAAAHMTWGAANELLTMNGYRLLADECGHPMLAELLRRIAAQESRHYSFYLLQAEWRLASSRLARFALPRFMDGAWTPVGVGEGYKTREEFQRVLEVLSRRPESERIIDRMDRRFAALPGLDRLRIYRSAASPAARVA